MHFFGSDAHRNYKEAGRLVEKGHSPKLIRIKGISYASHRFHGQCVTSFFSFRAIISLHIPRGERKVKTKTARAVLAAAHVLQASPQALSAAPASIKGECEG